MFSNAYWAARKFNYFRQHPAELAFLVILPGIVTLAWKTLSWLMFRKLARATVTVVSTLVLFYYGWKPALYAVPATTVAYSLCWVALVIGRGTARGSSAILAGVYRFIRIRRLWPQTCNATQFTTHDGLPIPTSNWRITQHGLTADLAVGSTGRPEISALDYADRVRSTLYVNRVKFKKLSSGMVRMHMEWGDHLKAIRSLAEIPPATGPDRLAVGVTEYGKVFELPIGKSVLVTGLTGSGKSSFAWALVYALIKAGIPFRLTIGDPKFVEWKIAFEALDESPIVYKYTSSPYQLGSGGLGKGQFMWNIDNDLTEKLKKVPVGQRYHTPTPDEPLDIIIIDETLPLTKELKRQDVQHPLARVVYQGRVVGSWAIFLSQTAEKEVIGPVRDLVPIKLAFALSGPNATRTALGEDSIGRGAYPHLLDPDEDMGICYYNDEGRFGAARIGFATDADTPFLVMGELPPESTQVADKFSWDRPCYVYEYYGLDEFGERELIYIGEAYDWEKRFKQHLEDDPTMMAEVVKEWTVVDLWPSKASAEYRERELIKAKHPKWNKQHNGGYYRGT